MKSFEGKINSAAETNQSDISRKTETEQEISETDEKSSVMRKLFKPARRLAGAMSLMTLGAAGEGAFNVPEAAAEEKQEKAISSKDPELAREGLKILSADYETFDDKNPQIVAERLRRYELIEKEARSLPPDERSEFIQQHTFTAWRHLELKYGANTPLSGAPNLHYINNKELLKNTEDLKKDIETLRNLFEHSTEGIALRLLTEEKTENTWKRLDAAKRVQMLLRNLLNGIAGGTPEAINSKKGLIAKLRNNISQINAYSTGDKQFTFEETDDISSGSILIRGNMKTGATINILVSYDMISHRPTAVGDIGFTPIHTIPELQKILKQEQR